MISGRKVGGQRASKKFTLSEGHPREIRKQFGHLKDTQAAKGSGTGGDNSMNIMPTFEDSARAVAAGGDNPTGNME